MKLQQVLFSNSEWKNHYTDTDFRADLCCLVLVFAEGSLITNPDTFQTIRNRYPNANIVASSTAGEILGENVHEKTVVVTAIQFEHSAVKCFETSIGDHSNSFETGKYLFSQV